jgi:hypothetical protein
MDGCRLGSSSADDDEQAPIPFDYGIYCLREFWTLISSTKRNTGHPGCLNARTRKYECEDFETGSHANFSLAYIRKHLVRPVAKCSPTTKRLAPPLKYSLRESRAPQDTADKLRTVPPWGLRMHPQHVHDLKSFTLESAIQRHGGEAEHVRNRFRELTPLWDQL